MGLVFMELDSMVEIGVGSYKGRDTEEMPNQEEKERQGVVGVVKVVKVVIIKLVKVGIIKVFEERGEEEVFTEGKQKGN